MARRERDAAADHRSTLLVPDVMVLFLSPDQACSQAVDPVVVVEVLSGDTQARDRV